MSNQDITRLVIGESIPLSMGVPVGQELRNTEVSNTLRWRDGRWETHVGLFDMVKKSLTKAPNVLQVPATKSPKTFRMGLGGLKHWKLAALASVGLVVCTVAIYGLLRLNKAPADDLAVVLDANTTGIDKKMAAVKTVDEPWIRPAPEQPPAEAVDSGVAVPVVPGSLNGPAPVEGRIAATPAQPPVQVQEPQKKVVDSKPVEQKAGDKKPGAPEAVILDMEPSPSATKPKEVAGVQVNATKQPAKELPKRATGSGLVAVTPDGKSALFTNTATRLPEKFGIGDKLPSGEVIKSIDASAGIVKTDAKEYRLE